MINIFTFVLNLFLAPPSVTGNASPHKALSRVSSRKSLSGVNGQPVCAFYLFQGGQRDEDLWNNPEMIASTLPSFRSYGVPVANSLFLLSDQALDGTSVTCSGRQITFKKASDNVEFVPDEFNNDHVLYICSLPEEVDEEDTGHIVHPLKGGEKDLETFVKTHNTGRCCGFTKKSNFKEQCRRVSFFSCEEGLFWCHHHRDQHRERCMKCV